MLVHFTIYGSVRIADKISTLYSDLNAFIGLKLFAFNLLRHTVNFDSLYSNDEKVNLLLLWRYKI